MEDYRNRLHGLVCVELQLSSYETGTLDAQRMSLLREGKFGVAMLVHLATFEQFSITGKDGEPRIPYRCARLIYDHNPNGRRLRSMNTSYCHQDRSI